MSTGGRPPVLDQTKKSQILALLKSGCGRAVAAAAVNCHPQTIGNQVKRDAEFAAQLAAAEHQAGLVHLANLNNAGTEAKYWRASAWMVERLFPETFAKPVRDTITPAQFSALLLHVAEIIVEEIPTASFRTQILKRFDHLLKEAYLAAAVPQLPGPNSLIPDPLTPNPQPLTSDP
jgi:hypothetical protein